MKLLHVTIQTDKFEQELEFYEKHAGLTIQADMRPQGKDLVFLGDDEEGTRIEIIANPEAGNAGNENLSIGFKTDDVETKREELIAEGFDVSPMLSPVPGVEFFFVTDPAGVKVQFM